MGKYFTTIDEKIIDEKIAEERELARREKQCTSPFGSAEAGEHEQFAEWLEELKMYKSLSPRELVSEKQRSDRDIEYHKGFNNGYNNAIDDFVEKAIKVVYEANNRDRNQKPRDIVADIHYKLLEISEQLKAGVTK